jgi:hypothetical protein
MSTHLYYPPGEDKPIEMGNQPSLSEGLENLRNVQMSRTVDKSVPLYRIVEDLQFFLETEEAGVPAELAEQFQAELLAKNAQAAAKVDDWIRAFRVIENQVLFLKQEKARLSEQQTRLENGQKRMRQHLASIVDMLPTPPMRGKQQPAKKLSGNIGSISLRKGSESVQITESGKLPTHCCDVSVRLSAVNWYLLREYIQRFAKSSADPSVMAMDIALACAPMELIPDKTKVHEHLEKAIETEGPAPWDLDDKTPEEQQIMLADARAAVFARYGARIIVGDPTVVVK